MKNPFVYGLIPVDKEFCQRAESIKIEKALKDNKNIFIFGRKKTGKTSIIKNLNIESKLSLYCDFNEISNENDVLKILTQTIFNIHKKNSTDEISLFKKYNQFKPTMTVDENGKYVIEINPEVISIESFKGLIKDEPVVLFFDHVQTILNSQSFRIEDFIQKFDGIQIVVVETNDLHNDKVHGEKFKKMVSFEIEDIFPKDYIKFVQNAFSESSLIIDNTFIESVLLKIDNISDSQLFFKTLYSLDDKDLVNDRGIEKVLSNIVQERKDLFDLIYTDLSPNQISLLNELSNTQNLKIYSKQFCDEIGVSSPNSVIKIVQGLVNKGLLYKKDANYKFFSLYFVLYIKSRK